MNHQTKTTPNSFYLTTLHSSKKNKDLLDKSGNLRPDIRRNIDYSIISKEAWDSVKNDYDIEVKVNDVYEVFISFSCNGLSFKNIYVHGVEKVFDVIQTLFVNKTFGIEYFKEMFEIKHEKKNIDPNINFDYFGSNNKKIVLFVEKKRQIKDESVAILESSIINDDTDVDEYLQSDLSRSLSLKSYIDDIRFYEDLYTIKITNNDLMLRSLSLPNDNLETNHPNIEANFAQNVQHTNNFNFLPTNKDNKNNKCKNNFNISKNSEIGDSKPIENSKLSLKSLNQTSFHELNSNKEKDIMINDNLSRNNMLYQNSNLNASCPSLNIITDIPKSHLKLFNKINSQKCIGIPNIGNSCYMNSSIQCLNNCALFSNFFFIYNSILRKNKTTDSNAEMPFLELALNKEYQKNGQIISAWSDFITHLKINLNLSPRVLKFLMGKKNSSFNNNDEQDAAEFIEALLSCLHEGLCYNQIKLYDFLSKIEPESSEYKEFYHLITKNQNEITSAEEKSDNLDTGNIDIKKEAKPNLKNYDIDLEFRNLINRERSIIAELFYGMFTNSLECQNCKFKKYKNELMMFLPLPIPNRINYHSSCTLILNNFSVPKKILIPLSYTVSEAIEYAKVEYEIQNSILAIEYDDTYPLNVLHLSKSIASVKNRIVFFEFNVSEDYVLCHLFYFKYFFYKKKFSTDFIIKTKNLSQNLYEKLYPFLKKKLTPEEFTKIIEVKQTEHSRVLNIPTYTIILKDIDTHFDKIIDSLSPGAIEKKDDINLTDCLNYYFKDDIVDFNCESCKVNTKYIIKSKLAKLPKYLIIHLKRFSYYSNNTKINTFIDFPENCLKISGSKYRLIATANHIEIGLGYGHYVSYIKKIDGWYCCNDSVVSRTLVPDKSTAYILFYEKFE